MYPSSDNVFAANAERARRRNGEDRLRLVGRNRSMALGFPRGGRRRERALPLVISRTTQRAPSSTRAPAASSSRSRPSSSGRSRYVMASSDVNGSCRYLHSHVTSARMRAIVRLSRSRRSGRRRGRLRDAAGSGSRRALQAKRSVSSFRGCIAACRRRSEALAKRASIAARGSTARERVCDLCPVQRDRGTVVCGFVNGRRSKSGEGQPRHAVQCKRTACCIRSSSRTATRRSVPRSRRAARQGQIARKGYQRTAERLWARPRACERPDAGGGRGRLVRHGRSFSLVLAPRPTSAVPDQPDGEVSSGAAARLDGAGSKRSLAPRRRRLGPKTNRARAAKLLAGVTKLGLTGRR